MKSKYDKRLTISEVPSTREKINPSESPTPREGGNFEISNGTSEITDWDSPLKNFCMELFFWIRGKCRCKWVVGEKTVRLIVKRIVGRHVLAMRGEWTHRD